MHRLLDVLWCCWYYLHRILLHFHHFSLLIGHNNRHIHWMQTVCNAFIRRNYGNECIPCECLWDSIVCENWKWKQQHTKCVIVHNNTKSTTENQMEQWKKWCQPNAYEHEIGLNIEQCNRFHRKSKRKHTHTHIHGACVCHCSYALFSLLRISYSRVLHGTTSTYSEKNEINCRFYSASALAIDHSILATGCCVNRYLSFGIVKMDFYQVGYHHSEQWPFPFSTLQ